MKSTILVFATVLLLGLFIESVNAQAGGPATLTVGRNGGCQKRIW